MQRFRASSSSPHSPGCVGESPVLGIPFSFQFTQQPCHSQEETGSKGNFKRELFGVLRQTYYGGTWNSRGVSQMEVATMGDDEVHHRIFNPENYVHLDAN